MIIVVWYRFDLGVLHKIVKLSVYGRWRYYLRHLHNRGLGADVYVTMEWYKLSKNGPAKTSVAPLVIVVYEIIVVARKHQPTYVLLP